MKKRLLLILLGICIFTSLLSSCAPTERYDSLYYVDPGEFTFGVRGTGTRVKQLVIKKGEEILLLENLKVSKNVGSRGGNYGLEVLDLNFDGHMDVMVADNLIGECLYYQCWLWNAQSSAFEKSEELTGLANIKTDEKLQAVFAYSTETKSTPSPDPEEADYTIIRDTTTKYIWEDGVFHASIAASITYYSETDRYEYSVYYYNPETQVLEEDQNLWMTPAEYREADLAFIYYFR